MEVSILDHCALKEMKLSKLMEFPWRKSQMTRFNLLWEQFERIWSSAHEVIPQGIMKWLKWETMVCSISHLASLKLLNVFPKPSLKIGTANAICWNSLGLFRDYSLNYIFFRNTTFLFLKIESWNFQHLFEKKVYECSQNFNSIRQRI